MSNALLAMSIALGARRSVHASRLEPTATRVKIGRYGSASGAARRQLSARSADFLANAKIWDAYENLPQKTLFDNEDLDLV